MKNIEKMILVLSILFGESMNLPAHGEQAAANGASGMSGQHPDPVAKVETRLANFRNELKITRDQDQAWAAYAETTRSSVRDIRDRMNEAMHDKPQTAPERFDRHIELMRERLASFEKMDQALKQLYAALTPEQRAIADRHFERLHH